MSKNEMSKRIDNFWSWWHLGRSGMMLQAWFVQVLLGDASLRANSVRKGYFAVHGNTEME